MKRSFFLFILTVLHTSVNAQWTEKYTYQNANYIWHLEAVGESVLWGAVILYSGYKGIIKTTDGGDTWFADTLDISRINCMHARSATTAYCGVLDNSNVRRIIKTTDGGINWVVQSSAFGGNPSADLWVERIYFFDDNNGFAFGDQTDGYNDIYTTTDGGDNWIKVPNTNIPPSYTNEWAINTTYYVLGNTVWIPVNIYNGNQIRIFKSSDKGYTWTVSTAFSTVINDLEPSAIVFKNQMEGILIASGCYYYNNSTYKIYNTSNGGDSWEETTFPLPIDPAFMCNVPGNSEAFVVTAPLTNIGSGYTLDGGNSWQMIEDSLDLCLTTFTLGTVGWSTSWNLPTIYKYTGSPLTGVEDQNPSPTIFALKQNYPNPFNPSTKIKYSVPQTSQVQIKIFDVLGNEIETLVNEEKLVGTYELMWNAEQLPSGVYFYQLLVSALQGKDGKAGSFVVTKKMILLK
jgi:photosystem II stability/assembly factor-like uncharacterized protein